MSTADNMNSADNMSMANDKTENWIKFFLEAGIEPTTAEDYSKIFVQNSITCDKLESLTEVKF